MFASYYGAGSGAVICCTREYERCLQLLLAELPDATVATVRVPSKPVKEARTGRPLDGVNGLLAGYAWAADAPGRVLVAYDWGCIANNPGAWQDLQEALPMLRCPKGATPGDLASLVVFVGPCFDLTPSNPLKGEIPILTLAPPTRAELQAVAQSLAPTNGAADSVGDALCGLSLDSATQAAAECLEAKGDWCPEHLREARRRFLRDAGLELWEPVPEIGGLSGLRGYLTAEVFPWIRDKQLAVRRILCAGLPGTGKSYMARWISGQLGCECARISIPSLKGSLVGQSEAALRRCLGALDAIGAESPVVVVMDEIDTIAREGLDGGTSSGMFAELLTWLQESTARAIVIATLNRLDKLDAALESRFEGRFFFDLPTERERADVARIHFARLGCDGGPFPGEWAAPLTEGFSSREIAESLCRSVARRSNRKPTREIIREVAASITPASRTQTEQLNLMRQAASTLRRANDPAEVTSRPTGRRIAGVQ